MRESKTTTLIKQQVTLIGAAVPDRDPPGRNESFDTQPTTETGGPRNHAMK